MAIGVVTVVLLTLLTIIVDFLIHRSLYHEVNNALIAKVQTFARQIEREGSMLDVDFHGNPPSEFLKAEHPDLYQISAMDSRLSVRSPRLAFDLPQIGGSLERPRLKTVTLPDGRVVRLTSLVFQPLEEADSETDSIENTTLPANEPTIPETAARIDWPDQGEVSLVIARDIEELNLAISRIRRILIGATFGTAAVILSVLSRIVSKSLGPLDNLISQIERTDHTSLNQRIEVPQLPRELVPVVDRFNGLLKRLDAAFVHEKALSGDIAHELR
ncbi:MAG: hypothetical protein FJ267_04600, partial [Planctomycetes bacterium]|nr:hypothetical protein [Planctomycetota bacterium]